MPHITIWVTDHFISQRVGAALKTGLGDAALAVASTVSESLIHATPVHIGYGILRGMEQVGAMAELNKKDWFLLDLGYTEPGHFSGNYRIGYKGTQSLFDETFLAPASPVNVAPWKEGGDDALICPATDYVSSYYKLDDAAWCDDAVALAKRLKLNPKIRRKGDPENLDEALGKAACVITFNSSVAWKALQKGIPAFSDVARSTVGSWHGARGMESLAALKECSRDTLFRFMAASQLSLLQIQQGQIKAILERYSGHI